MLDRLIDEEKLDVEQVERAQFPVELWVDDEPKPVAVSFVEALHMVEQFKDEVFMPAFSIICLVYQSVDWAKFIYEQVIKYTDLSYAEFFFVANDANEDVLRFLQDNYIPHIEFSSPPDKAGEWYINRVYRAFNFGANHARGDNLIFINSDMGLSPHWLENLWRAYDGKSCISSRLVESGRLRSGQFGIEKKFGQYPSEYSEHEFIKYAAAISKPEVRRGGLYMPLLIRKSHFEAVNGYPEGNIVPGSSLFSPQIAEEGKSSVSGDKVLMQKLAEKEIEHRTASDSVVYHFQMGEMLTPGHGEQNEVIHLAICNDLLTGSMGERVLWEYLIESLQSAVGLDAKTVGTIPDYASACRRYIHKYYPDVSILIQNATFIGTIEPSIYTIAFLQDNLRAMGADTRQQEFNLMRANKIVANSHSVAIGYRDFDIEVIPIGVDHHLFQPMNRKHLRQKHRFGSERIGIFVGSLSEVKGWSRVRDRIQRFPEITWIVVSKHNEDPHLSNVRPYSRISQEVLAELYNCADFFIIGSPLETQCLAAIEACLCDTPVIMRRTGIFTSFSEEEMAKVGIFGEDFDEAIEHIDDVDFFPRETILHRDLTVEATVRKWERLVFDAMQEVRSQRIGKPEGSSPTAGRLQKQFVAIEYRVYLLRLTVMQYKFVVVAIMRKVDPLRWLIHLLRRLLS